MKQFANLYLPELQPRHDKWTLAGLTLSSAVLAVVLLMLNFAVSYLAEGEREHARQIGTQVQQQQALLEVQQELLEQRINDPSLLAEIAELEEKLAERQRLQQQMLSMTSAEPVSFAALLTDIARVDSADLWLERIGYSQGRLNLDGLTQRPEVLPRWLASFSDHATLRGRQFSVFELRDEADGPLHFSVGSSASAERQVGARR